MFQGSFIVKEVFGECGDGGVCHVQTKIYKGGRKMKKKLLAGMAVGFSVVAMGNIASATDFDFSGVLQSHNDVLLVNFTANTDTTVTLFSSSWIDGNHGFDPMLGLWNNTGDLIIWQDDGGNIGSTLSNGVSYYHGSWDSYYSADIAAGTYTVSLSTYYNAPNGNNLSDGFAYDNDTPIAFANWYQPANGYQTGDYEFHVLNVDTASSNQPVPEPATMLLFGTGLAGLVGARLRRKK